VRFLVDAHLPVRLCVLLRAAGHDAVHTSELPEGNRSVDRALMRVAVEQGRVVVTKDTDFYYSLLIGGDSFQLLLIRTGNIRAATLLELVGRHLEGILLALGTNTLVELHFEGPRVLR